MCRHMPRMFFSLTFRCGVITHLNAPSFQAPCLVLGRVVMTGRKARRWSGASQVRLGLLPVSGCGDARVAPPLPHHFVCVEKFTLPYLTLTTERCTRAGT